MCQIDLTNPSDLLTIVVIGITGGIGVKIGINVFDRVSNMLTSYTTPPNYHVRPHVCQPHCAMYPDQLHHGQIPLNNANN